MTKNKKAKKTKKTDFTFIIVSNDGLEAQEGGFASAQVVAKDLVENGKGNVSIFKVVQAWDVYFPEEPDPEVVECGLDEIAI